MEENRKMLEKEKVHNFAGGYNTFLRKDVFKFRISTVVPLKFGT